jgi:hypothetical protein
MPGLLHGSEKFEIDANPKGWLRLELQEDPDLPGEPLFDVDAAIKRVRTITIEELAAALEQVYEMSIGSGADPKNYIAQLKGTKILLSQSLTYTNIVHRLFYMTTKDLRNIWMEYEDYMGKNSLMEMDLSYDPADWFKDTSFSETTSGILYFLCITGVIQALGVKVEGSNLHLEMPTQAFDIKPQELDEDLDDDWQPAPIPTIADLTD